MRISVALRCCLGAFVFMGLAVSSSRLGAQDKLVTEGEDIKYFKGSEAPPAEWITQSFDDSTWLDGQTPIGYSTDVPYKTLVNDMQNNYWSIFIRKKFNVPDAKALKALKLSLKYDDGFIAYMNGGEILRKAMPAGAVDNTTPALAHETNVTFEANLLSCDALDAIGLKTGENILAIEVHNETLASSDCTLSVEIESVSAVCPTNLVCTVRTTSVPPQVVVRWTKPTGFVYDELALYRNDVKIDPGPVKTATSYTDRTPAQGTNNYRLVATACGVECTGGDQPTCTAEVGGTAEQFRRGDVDDSGTVNLTDAVKLLAHLFRGEAAPACPDAADMDDDSSLKLTDAVYLLTALFRGGAAPPAPGIETCGPDPTQDDLGACTYTHCP